MANAKRVVLVKPGDVLVFGNVGEISAEDAHGLVQMLKERLHLSAVVVFTGDIDLASVPRG